MGKIRGAKRSGGDTPEQRAAMIHDTRYDLDLLVASHMANHGQQITAVDAHHHDAAHDPYSGIAFVASHL